MTKEEQVFKALLEIDGLMLEKGVIIDWQKEQIDIRFNNEMFGFIMLSDAIEFLHTNNLLVN
ncbi:hypothetical protein [Bacillus mojavensis]